MRPGASFACLTKEKSFNEMTGSTQGMTLRINPPKNPSSRKCQSEPAGFAGVGVDAVAGRASAFFVKVPLLPVAGGWAVELPFDGRPAPPSPTAGRTGLNHAGRVYGGRPFARNGVADPVAIRGGQHEHTHDFVRSGGVGSNRQPYNGSGKIFATRKNLDGWVTNFHVVRRQREKVDSEFRRVRHRQVKL